MKTNSLWWNVQQVIGGTFNFLSIVAYYVGFGLFRLAKMSIGKRASKKKLSIAERLARAPGEGPKTYVSDTRWHVGQTDPTHPRFNREILKL